MKPGFIIITIFSILIAASCLSVEPDPVLEGRSNKAILPRYCFKAGDEFIAELITGAETKIITKTQTISVPSETTITSRFKADKVDEKGVATFTMKISRIIMETKGSRGMIMDTDKPGKAAKRKDNYLLTMIEVPVTVKVKPTGEIIDTDFRKLQEALKKADQAPLLSNANDILENLFQSAFIQLPEKAVNAGDIFDAGELIRPMPGSSEVVSRMRYEVVVISANEKSVLMRPETKITIRNQEQSMVKMELDSSQMRGWILFDVEKGNVSKSDTELQMKITMSQQEMKIKNQITTRASYTVTSVSKIK